MVELYSCKTVIMEFISTKRNGRALLYQGYKYVINRRGWDGRIFWRWGQSIPCSGAMTTLEDEIVSQWDIYNHPPDEAELQAEKIVNKLKIAVKESIRPIPSIYHDHFQEITMLLNKEKVPAKMPILGQIRTSHCTTDKERDYLLYQTQEVMWYLQMSGWKNLLEVKFLVQMMEVEIRRFWYR